MGTARATTLIVPTWFHTQTITSPCVTACRVEQSSPNNQAACLDLAQHFIAQHGQHPSASPDPDGMLYFLHIPRTAGRTYHACFLKQVVSQPGGKKASMALYILQLSKSSTAS